MITNLVGLQPYFEQVEAGRQELALGVASVPVKVLRSSSLRRKRQASDLPTIQRVRP